MLMNIEKNYKTIKSEELDKRAITFESSYEHSQIFVNET